MKSRGGPLIIVNSTGHLVAGLEERRAPHESRESAGKKVSEGKASTFFAAATQEETPLPTAEQVRTYVARLGRPRLRTRKPRRESQTEKVIRSAEKVLAHVRRLQRRRE